MSDIANRSGTFTGNQRIGSTAVKAGRRPIARNTIDGVPGSPLNDGDYPGDLIVGVSDISDLYNNRFISYANSSSSGTDILWNHSVTGNIVPNSSGSYNLGSSAFTFNTLFASSGSLRGPLYFPKGTSAGLIFPDNDASTTYIRQGNTTVMSWAYGPNIIQFGYAISTILEQINSDNQPAQLTLQNSNGLTPYGRFGGYVADGNNVFLTSATVGQRLTIGNRHTSTSEGEWLRVGFVGETGYVASIASGTGVPRPLRLEAGSGTHRTTLGLTTANSGQITYGVAPLTGPSGLSRIPIQISGIQYYLLATTQ